MAKSDVGTITVYLEAISAQFDAGIKKATKSIDKLESRLSKGSLAFTEFQSKIGITVAAVEVLAKAASALASAIKGDFDGLVETFKQMPMGIGAAFSAMYDFSARWIWGISGQVEQVEKQIARIEKQQKLFATLNEQGEKRRANLVKQRTDLERNKKGMLEAELTLERSLDVIAANRAKEFRGIKASQSVGEIGNAEAKRRLDRIIDDYDSLRRIEIERYDIAVDRLALEDQSNLIQNIEQAAQAEESRLRETSAHWASYYSMLGHGHEMRLRNAALLNKRLQDVYAAQTAELIKQNATEEDLAAVRQKRADQELRYKRFLEIESARMRAKLSDSERPSAVSMSFGTPVGSITLPDRANTAALMREHLKEQKRTTDAIDALSSILNNWSVIP